MGTTVPILVGIDCRLWVGNSVCVVLHYYNSNNPNMADKDDQNFVKVRRIGTVEHSHQHDDLGDKW
jgi:hypothetical protein